MAQPGYIFGKGTPDTYESLQAKRRTAERFGLAAMRTPQNLGEGLSALGQAIAYRRLMNQADAGDAAGRAAYDEKRSSVLGALMGRSLGGTPGFNPGAPITPPDPSSPDAIGADAMAAIGKASYTPGDRESFTSAIWPHALRVAEKTGLDPRLVVAQAAQETGWGKSAPGNNFFGVKSHGKPGGNNFATNEVIGGETVRVNDSFRGYDSMGQSADDYAQFLLDNPRYKEMLSAPDLEGQVAALGRSGYATDPNYAASVGSIAGGITPQMNPGASIPAIMEIMADPYAPQGDKMVLGALLEQQLAQMQPPDPMQALEMEYKQAQIDQMRNPQMADAPQVETFYDQTTGQQYKAQWNGQEWVPVGGVQAADGPLVEVNTGGGKFEEAFAKGDADTVATVYNSGLAATRNLGRIDQLEALLNASPTGAGAALAQIAGEWGINTEGLDQIQAAQAVINSLVPEQRQPGSGPMSDADLALFKQSLPRIINQPGGNQTIVNTMRGIAQYDAEGAAIVQRLRSGEIDRPTAFKLLQDRKNPLAGMKVPTAAKAGAGDLTPEERQYLGIP